MSTRSEAVVPPEAKSRSASGRLLRPVPPPLQFSCDFESGNFERVVQRSAVEYDVFVRGDTENRNQRIWYYFKVSPLARHQRIILNILGMSKSRSMYRDGFSPLVRSSSNPEWYSSVAFPKPTDRSRLPSFQCFWYQDPTRDNHYVLSIFFESSKSNESYYFAYCYPYTFLDVQRLIQHYKESSLVMTHEVLTHSIQGRSVDLLKFCTPSTQRRSAVVITSRVHPGESPSSYVMEGILEVLNSLSPQSRHLREMFDFYVIPMLNPDGVSIGNYRSNRLGYDLNRQWRTPSPYFQPSIYYTKELIRNLYRNPNVKLELYLDLHGHTSTANSFLYANAQSSQKSMYQTKIFPFLLSTASDDFSLFACRYDNDVNKKGCARRELQEELPGLLCYTLEVSFSHYINPKKQRVNYSIEKYRDLGRKVCESLLSFKSQSLH